MTSTSFQPADFLIHSHRFASLVDGAHLLIMGAIHGDEVCGTNGIAAVMPRLASGEIPLLKGSVTFLPVCNPRAHRENIRFVDENLNRVFEPQQKEGLSYERQLANRLCPFVQAADYVLDLHSMGATGGAFTFLDDEREPFIQFAKAVGAETIVTGWPEVQSAPDTINESDTITYARRLGKVGILVECGENGHPDADKVAEKVILNTLAHFGLVAAEHAAPSPDSPPRTIRMQRTVIARQEGRLTRPYVNFSPVCEGEIIGTYADGTQEIAGQDGFIVLPKEKASIGQEWFYFALPE